MDEGKVVEAKSKSKIKWFRNRALIIIGCLLLGFVVGYYIGYNMGLEKAADILVK